jgi:hypothetical protein
MGEMRQVPVNLSHEDLLTVLDDIRARVAEGDSFEGHIEWMIPVDDDAPARSFDVQASYRVGNTMGQGGMRMIGEWREVPACRTCDGSGVLQVPDGDGESVSEQDCPDRGHEARIDAILGSPEHERIIREVLRRHAGEGSPPECYFWEPGPARCLFEPLIPGLEPCSDCPDPVHDRARTDGLSAVAEAVLKEADRWELYPARGDDHRALADEYARDVRDVLTRLLARWQRDAVAHPEDTSEHRAERNQLDACARSLSAVLLPDDPAKEG